jgi:hypothetical protein
MGKTQDGHNKNKEGTRGRPLIDEDEFPLKLGRLDHRREDFWISYCEICQHLSIDRNISNLQTMDQPAVGGAILAGCGIDPSNP